MSERIRDIMRMIRVSPCPHASLSPQITRDFVPAASQPIPGMGLARIEQIKFYVIVIICW